MGQIRDIIYEEKLYRCKICGEEKVKKRRDSNQAPKYCDKCRRKIKLQNLKAARLARQQYALENKIKSAITVIAPDGYPVKLRSAEEKQFYENRLAEFKKDYEFTASSDYGLLSRLLALEIEIHRLNKQLTLKFSTKKANSLAKLTEEYRRCQNDLGIIRSKRIDEKDTESPAQIVQDLINRFKEFREKHPEKFLWKCKHCGELNTLYYETTTNKSRETVC